MKKITIFVLLIVAMTAQAQQRQISYVEPSGSWYHVYDTK